MATSPSESVRVLGRANLEAEEASGHEDPYCQVPGNLQIMKLRVAMCEVSIFFVVCPPTLNPIQGLVGGLRQKTGEKGLACIPKTVGSAF